MKTITHKIQLSIFALSLATAVAVAQTTTKNSMNVNNTETERIKKDIVLTVNKSFDKVTPIKPTEVASISTPSGNLRLTAVPSSEGVFHAGSLVLGAGIVYQKDLLPLMLAAEYGIGRNIGVEVRGWYGSKTKDGVLYRDGVLGVGLNYHLSGNITNSSSRFDTYFGGVYGKILDQSGSAFYAQAGARYFFIGRLGAFGNFNIGLIGSRGTNLSVGLIYSLF